MRTTSYAMLLTLIALPAGCGGGDPATLGEPAGALIVARTYELPYRGSITLDVPATWVEEVRRAPGGLATSVEYRPPTGDAFRLAFSIRSNLQEDPAFNAPERIDRMVEETVAGLNGTYDGAPPALEIVDGPQSKGRMIRVSHLSGYWIEKKFPRRVQALLAVDDLLVGAVLVATEPDPELERRFADIVRGIARLRPGGLDAGTEGPSLTDGTLSNPAGGYTLSVPPGWSLRDASNAQLAMIDRKLGPATFSILLKPATGDVAAEFEQLAEGLRRRPGVEIVDERGHEVGGLPAIRMESRVTVGQTTFSSRTYAVVVGSKTCFLGVETADELRERVFDEVERMVASIRFAAE